MFLVENANAPVADRHLWAEVIMPENFNKKQRTFSQYILRNLKSVTCLDYW